MYIPIAISDYPLAAVKQFTIIRTRKSNENSSIIGYLRNTRKCMDD